MAEEKDARPEWMGEFQKLNTGSSYPLTPHPQPAVGGSPSERRRHARFGVEDAPAALRRKGLLPFLRAGKAREALDLSEGGARLVAAERVPPGSRVHVTIRIGKFQDSVESDAEVRWCHQKTGGQEEYILGIMFIGDSADRSRKIGAMRGYFTSPQFQTAREKRLREKPGDLFLKR